MFSGPHRASLLSDAVPAETSKGDHRFRVFMDHGPVLGWMKDEAGRFVFVNRRFEKHMGLSSAEIIGRTFSDVMPIEIAEPIEAREREVLRSGRPIESTEEVLSADGVKHIWLVYRFPVEEGGVRMLGGIALDITDRHSAEVAMREAEERHRQILDAIPDWVFVKGPQSRIVWANKAFREGYGMSNEQLQGMIDAPFNEPDYTQQYIRDDAQVAATGKPLEIPEEPVTRHDGTVLYVNTIKAPIFDSSGKVVMTVGVSRDLGERKRLEAQLRVADRMASLGTLAAGVAHEINNPLAYIIANLDMLCEELRRDEPADLNELASHARDGAEQVRKIVRGLRAFSRADEEPRTRMDLPHALEQAIAMTATETRHRAQLVKQYGSTPVIEADETRLTQVFINLLLNAAQALPEGHADDNQIRIRTSTDHRGRAVVEVEDTGSGISEDVLPRIFEPFFTTKPIGIGTGLGLSICHGIVTAMGGELSVHSELGKGSLFRVALPAAVTAVSAPQPRSIASLAPERRAHVLIVDDDVLVGGALQRALSREHDVACCSSAKQALDLIARGERFDVIFCDLMMPTMTGMDFYVELERSSPEHCDKTVFVTGGAFSPSARKFLEETSVEWLEKPFAIARVRAMVRRMVK